MPAAGDLDATEEGVGAVRAAAIRAGLHLLLALHFQLLLVHLLVVEESRAHLDAGVGVESANLAREHQLLADAPKLGHPVCKAFLARAPVGH